jgi:hypothetical protein
VDASTTPTSINAKGEITGYYVDFAGNNHGFVRDPNGTITTFDPPGSLSTFVAGINDEGTITGSYSYEPGLYRAFVRDPKGNFTTFDPPGSISTGAVSINAGGAVTGSYNEVNLVKHGFLRRADGMLISFDPPGSTSTVPTSINAKREITGFYCTISFTPPEVCVGTPLDPFSVPTHGFLRRPGGEIVSFDAPPPPATAPGGVYPGSGSALSGVAGINDAGTITGSYAFLNGFLRELQSGFVRDPDGKLTSFGLDVADETIPSSINNKGAITGWISLFPLGFTLYSGFVRSPEGTIAMFVPPFCTSTINDTLINNIFPTSINDEGVITGYCLSTSPSVSRLGWVRFP